MQKLHEWYYLARVYRLNFIEAKISGDIFNTSNFKLNVKLAELHTIYRLQMLDITMMTVCRYCGASSNRARAMCPTVATIV
jgi:hypothetical protein